MKVLFILGALFVLLISGCKVNNNHPVPNIPFDVTIDMTLPLYDDLMGVGGYAYVNAGSRGVIVYRRGIEDFVAFDRHSPADINGTCDQPLTPDANNFLMLNDTCNNAQFSLYDGSPMSGSEFGLRQYAVAWGGGNTLRIYN
ncbi:MAG: hypothetical protein DCO96_08635 [Fluviicola sp. XM-24bin1]|nr:MAG: hypothetical protein DCO96_08635 [Fluviicola sp. XM-24bin1]